MPTWRHETRRIKYAGGLQGESGAAAGCVAARLVSIDCCLANARRPVQNSIACVRHTQLGIAGISTLARIPQ